VDAFSVDTVRVVKRGQLADGTVDTVRFLPICIVEKRDVGLNGGGGFRR
jgi:hypothetical protein